jgi:hypothetical protein
MPLQISDEASVRQARAFILLLFAKITNYPKKDSEVSRQTLYILLMPHLFRKKITGRF